MKRLFLICLFVFAFSSGAAFAQISPRFVDAFTDQSMNPEVWTTFIDGIGPIAQEINGQVEVTLPADTHEAEAPHSFGGGFKTVRCLRGDFDVQIDYALIGWPTGSGVRVGLGLFPDGSGQMGNVQRSSFGPAENGPVEMYAVDYQTGGGGVPTDHGSGALRLARVGNMLTAGVLVNNQWVELYRHEFSTANYHIAFTAWSHDHVFSHQEVKIAFDNFIIHYGEFVDPGTPSGGVTIQGRVDVTQPTEQPQSNHRFVQLPKYNGTLPKQCGPYKRLQMVLPKVKVQSIHTSNTPSGRGK